MSFLHYTLLYFTIPYLSTLYHAFLHYTILFYAMPYFSALSSIYIFYAIPYFSALCPTYLLNWSFYPCTPSPYWLWINWYCPSMVFIFSDWSKTLSIYLINVLLLLLYTQVFLRVQFLALFFSPCILSLCLPLLTHTLLYTIHLLMTYNYRCLLPLIKYLSYFTLCSYVWVMSKLGQLQTWLDLMTTR